MIHTDDESSSYTKNNLIKPFTNAEYREIRWVAANNKIDI